MKILTEEGRLAFRNWVKRSKSQQVHTDEHPKHILENEHNFFSFHIDNNLPVFAAGLTKYSFIEAIIPIIEKLENSDFDKINMPNVFDTLAIIYFEFICPTKSEYWNPSGIEFYCLEDSVFRKYRHRISGPLNLVRAGRESVKPFFMVAPSTMGEYESNMGSRQQIAGNKSILTVVKALYFSEDLGKLESGITTTQKFSPKGSKPKTIGKAGTIRRFGQVTNQLTRIYDIYEAPLDTFLSILPKEFNRWK